MVEYEVSERSDETVTLRLQGEMTGERPVEELHRALMRHYVDDGVRYIRADLSGVDTISLEGVAVLLALWRESARRGKRFEVDGTHGQVEEKLRVTGVLHMLEGGR